MSRYTGPTTRINRRFGMAIFPANKSFGAAPIPEGNMDQIFGEKQAITVPDYWRNKNFA